MNPRLAIREWIAANTSHAEPDALHDETPILEARYLTSLQITDLLLFIEDLRGGPLDIEELTPRAFRSVDAICQAFFPQPAAPAPAR